jgi:predicted DNA-binding transcriptional regulator YafY
VYLPVQNIAFTELLALTMSVRQLSASGDFVLAYEALEAIKKMIANTEEGQREIFTSCLDEIVLQEGFGCKRQVLDDLNQALSENRQIAISYTRPTDESPNTHTVNPYQIYFKRRALYLDAFDTEAQQYLVFRVNRISKVQPTQITFTRKDDYNFAQRHRHVFSVFVSDSVQSVRVRFAKKIAPFIRETYWHHSQQITEQKDGSLLFEVEVNEPREVGWWVLRWGADAEVLEPESLRQELRETAEGLVGLYAQKRS